MPFTLEGLRRTATGLRNDFCAGSHKEGVPLSRVWSTRFLKAHNLKDLQGEEKTINRSVAESHTCLLDWFGEGAGKRGLVLNTELGVVVSGTCIYHKRL